jgi:hypothetical protein
VSYVVNGRKYTVEFNVGDTGLAIETDPVRSIFVGTPPARTTYYVGEIFDPTGLEVYRGLHTFTTQVLGFADLDITPARPLSLSDTFVTSLMEITAPACQ